MAECHTAKFLQASITIILLRSDGSVVGCGTDDYGECDIEPPEAGTWYVADVPCSRTLCCKQSLFVKMMPCCWFALAGEEVLRFNAHPYELWSILMVNNH